MLHIVLTTECYTFSSDRSCPLVIIVGMSVYPLYIGCFFMPIFVRAATINYKNLFKAKQRYLFFNNKNNFKNEKNRLFDSTFMLT